MEPQEHIAAMASYALAQMDVPAGKRLISLAQNECLRAPSPRVIDAANRAVNGGAMYPDPDWSGLRTALADRHGVDAEGILCGAGSLDLIGAIARVYAGPGRAMLAPVHAYPFFRTAAQMAGARLDTAPELDATVSVDAMLAAVRPDTRVVCVANPANPTGTRISRAELMRLRAGLSHNVLLIIDEAYGEFADHLNTSVFDMVQGGNVVVLRTFSKAYAMAGFRVGWGLFPVEVAAQLRKVLNPNNVSVVSQMAALAAVEDEEYMRETCAMTAHLRDHATERLQAAGIAVFPSLTNFVLMDLGTVEAAQTADAALRAEGVFVRPQGGAGLPHCLRMTIGPAAELDMAITLLEHWRQT
jgi:histidinol-phosphate aminotransferase